jgi:CSLREA domain-containing protein
MPATALLHKTIWVERRARTLTYYLLAVLAAASIGVLLMAKPAYAKTFTVNSTGDLADPGLNGVCDVSPFTTGLQCTLRAAIQEANNTSVADTINFGVPSTSANCDSTTKVCTISPTSELPTITEPVTINGYTQTGASRNTARGRTTAQLKIELDGSQAEGTLVDGLTIRGAPNTVVTGLVINDFDGSGVLLIFSVSDAETTDVVIKGNFIGTDPTGTQAEGNDSGVQIFGGNETRRNTIGGTSAADVNLISGNAFENVFLRSPGNKIQGNLIGTQRNGTSALSAAGFATGVDITPGASNNIIGDNNPSDDPASGPPNAANVIAFNGDEGVSIASSSESPAVGNRILGNSIFENGDLGIDLRGDGITPNDRLDPDNGPNHVQNFPELTSARNIADGTSSVSGRLNSRANKEYTIQFFSSPEADPSGFGEGKKFIGQKSVTTNANGNASFTFKPAQRLSLGEFITATATLRTTGDTSEFSIARKVVLG